MHRTWTICIFCSSFDFLSHQIHCLGPFFFFSLSLPSLCSKWILNNSSCFASIIASWLHAKYHFDDGNIKIQWTKQRKFVKCQLVVDVYCWYGNSKTMPTMQSALVHSWLRLKYKPQWWYMEIECSICLGPMIHKVESDFVCSFDSNHFSSVRFAKIKTLHKGCPKHI